MENLSSDIVLEILTRLPKTKTGFESALQCRKVCKLWKDLLGKPKTGTLIAKTPYWGSVELYYREQSCDQMVNFTEEGKQNFDKIVTEIGSIGTDIWYFSLVGSVNGLVCYETLGVIYIFNPITGERICLSSDIKERNKRKRTRDPQMDRCFGCAGLGYIHSTNEYKVVKICYVKNRKQSVQVYTLGDACGWRDKPDTTYKLGEPGVFANEALYWFIVKHKCYILVAFDLADETFTCLPSPAPPCHVHSNSYVNLRSVEGNLYLCRRDKKQDETMMDIWILKKKNMDNCRRNTRLKRRTYFIWIQLFSITWDSLSYCPCQLLSLTKSEILLWQDGVLSCYDPTTFKKIWYVEGKEKESKVYQAIPHMHSLVSLKELGEVLVGPLEGHPKQLVTR